MNHSNRMSLLALGVMFIAMVSQNACALTIEIRVSNGTELTPGEFPFLASLLIILPDKRNALCGGSIIDNRHILTAAHCIHCPNSTVVAKLGCHDLRKECKETKRDINFTGQIGRGSIGPIRLPESSRDDFSNDEWLTLIGWGGKSYVPKKAKIIARRLRPGDKSKFCAGFPEKNSEKGDSGGPLFRTDPKTNSSTLVGIVKGSGWCKGKWSGIYTRVFFLLDWINEFRSQTTK